MSKKEKAEDPSRTGQKKAVGALPPQPSAQEATPALSGAALENNNWASCSHSANSLAQSWAGPSWALCSMLECRQTLWLASG